MADEEKSDNRQGQLFNPDIRADESSPRDSTKGKVGADEANLANKLGKGYTPFEKTLGRGMAGELIKPGALLHKPIKLLLRNKKKSIGGAILGLIIGLLMLMANVFHGPLQFIHFSQLLQQFHMQPNEDFGSDRAFRTLIYGSVGQAERGRLGLTTNILADRWERRLADNGFRPLYSNNTGRFVGFELINDTGLFKAAAGDKASTVFQELADNDVQIRTYGELDADGVPAHRSKDGVPDKSAMVLDLSDRDKCNFSCMRKVIRAVGKQTGSFKAYSAVSSRLLIKRAGVNFHPINKIRGKLDEAAKKRVLKKRADDIKNGVEPASTSVDRDGQETESDKDSDDTDVKASEEANAAISEVESAEDAEALKSVKGRLIAGGIAGGATAMVGVFCAANSFGNDVPKYKYDNIAKPAQRSGFWTMASGDQVRSGLGLDFWTLGAFSPNFADKENGTNYGDANTINQELGKKPSSDKKYAPPSEMSAKNINDKGEFFAKLEAIPGLEAVCAAQAAVFGLPVIKQISGVIGSITGTAANAALSAPPFNTSIEELYGSALSAAAGRSINPFPQGAEWGNIDNIGLFYAGINQAMSMGGVQMTGQASAEIKAEQQYLAEQENKTKSFAARYLDPFSPITLVGSTLMKAPTNMSQLSSVLSMPKNGFMDLINTFGSILSPQAKALTVPSAQEIYGFPDFGFTLDEQSNDRFENPYENAVYVEDATNDGKRLNDLNDKYGECFGVRISADDTGVHIESKDQDSDEVNMFKVAEKGKCNPQKNNDPDFLPYRFYISDVLTAVSLSCVEANNEEACTEIGMTISGSGEGAEADGAINPNIFVLGDSLTVGMRDSGDLAGKLEAKEWDPTKIEATENRTVSQALANDIDKNKTNIQKAGTVVIALGTNKEAGFKEKVKDLIKKIRSPDFAPDAQIFWMNAYGGKDNYREVNDDLADLSSSEDFEIIDWAKEARLKPEKYPWSDGPQIHHSTLGYRNKADFLVKSIGAPPAGIIDGVECPSTLKSTNVGGTKYYQMPPAPNGEYTFNGGTPPGQRYGKRALICTIYTVAKAYKAKYGDTSTVKIGDLNASGHDSHKWGVAVDITATGAIGAANTTDGAYNKNATVEFGKMFVDTGKIKNIWWCPSDNSTQLIKQYAESKGRSITIQCEPNHEDHFHVDINVPRGAEHTP